MEGIDKLLDRLGFYDLIGVLLPGIIATHFTLIADKIVFEWGISVFLSTNNMLFFLCVSYFVGVVLQELGSLIMKNQFDGGEILSWAMKPSNQYRDSITEFEYKKLEEAMTSAFPDVEDSMERLSLTYDYCKYSGGNSSAAEKDHSIAAMSRCMCVYFFLLGVGLLIKSSEIRSQSAFIASVVSFLLMVIMGYRTFRFYKIRYIRIFRKYYYECYRKKEKENT